MRRLGQIQSDAAGAAAAVAADESPRARVLNKLLEELGKAIRSCDTPGKDTPYINSVKKKLIDESARIKQMLDSLPLVNRANLEFYLSGFKRFEKWLNLNISDIIDVGLTPDEQALFKTKFKGLGKIVIEIIKDLSAGQATQPPMLPRPHPTPRDQKRIRQQQKALKNDKVFRSFLEFVRELGESDYTVPKCFICYAWAADAFPQEYWVQDFLVKLREDLMAAGIRVSLDIRSIKPGGDGGAYMEQGIAESDFALLIGTESLLLKSSNPYRHVVVTELQLLMEKASDVTSNKEAPYDKPVIPMLLTGTIQTSFPAAFRSIGIVKRSFMPQGYAEAVKNLIVHFYVMNNNAQIEAEWAKVKDHLNTNPELFALFNESKESIIQGYANTLAAGTRISLKEYLSRLEEDSSMPFDGCDCTAIDLTGGDISGFNFSGAIFQLAQLAGVKMRGAIIEGVNISGCKGISAQMLSEASYTHLIIDPSDHNNLRLRDEAAIIRATSDGATHAMRTHTVFSSSGGGGGGGASARYDHDAAGPAGPVRVKPPGSCLSRLFGQHHPGDLLSLEQQKANTRVANRIKKFMLTRNVMTQLQQNESLMLVWLSVRDIRDEFGEIDLSSDKVSNDVCKSVVFVRQVTNNFVLKWQKIASMTKGPNEWTPTPNKMYRDLKKLRPAVKQQLDKIYVYADLPDAYEQNEGANIFLSDDSSEEGVDGTAGQSNIATTATSDVASGSGNCIDASEAGVGDAGDEQLGSDAAGVARPARVMRHQTLLSQFFRQHRPGRAISREQREANTQVANRIKKFMLTTNVMTELEDNEDLRRVGCSIKAIRKEFEEIDSELNRVSHDVRASITSVCEITDEFLCKYKKRLSKLHASNQRAPMPSKLYEDLKILRSEVKEKLKNIYVYADLPDAYEKNEGSNIFSGDVSSAEAGVDGTVGQSNIATTATRDVASSGRDCRDESELDDSSDTSSSETSDTSSTDSTETDETDSDHDATSGAARAPASR